MWHVASQAVGCQTRPIPIPLWRNRDFLLLWTGQVVSTLGTRISGLAYPLLVLAVTGSPAKAGLVASAQAAPFLIWFLPAGALVDRWSRKRIMLAADAGRAVALASVAVAVVLGRTDPLGAVPSLLRQDPPTPPQPRRDRRANAALYRIALTRSRGDHRTRTYLEHRSNQGSSRREAFRCLKRYIAREIYHLIQQLNLTAQPARTT